VTGMSTSSTTPRARTLVSTIFERDKPSRSSGNRGQRAREARTSGLRK
jgi:hypothetical protein